MTMDRYYSVRVGNSNVDLNGEQFEDYDGAKTFAENVLLGRLGEGLPPENHHIVRVEAGVAKVVSTLR